MRLDLGYDGTNFSGWARQPDRRTVQGELEKALGLVLRLPGPPRVACAGRTDAGVHARGQVAHCDVPADAWSGVQSRGPAYVVRRLAGVTGRDLAVHAIGPAAAGFHARWSALSRRYSYRVCDDPSGPDPLLRTWVLDYHGVAGRRLDLDAMQTAADLLLGEQDFCSFCRRRDGASTIRTLKSLTWRRESDGTAVMDIEADAFCHGMVRALAGALLQVGSGRRDSGWPRLLMVGKLRIPSANSAPGHGLVLEAVGYPADDELAAQADRSRRFRGEEPGGPAGRLIL